MKNNKIILVAVVACAMLSGCGNTYVESTISDSAERNIVVDFTADTEVTPELISQVEAATGSTYSSHPYENCYRFEANEASYEAIEAACEGISTLECVADAHTEYHK
ncbi:hypothetical protein [Butyrivibrio sp. VCB2006]|uniref:hypothetical protein n=1 Tax=Butyrivibrio sp. VCB2006 TaxID=1280679 RepID=UPI00041E1245|nr:hypothetical protein [Butyrivibrio sp. VCB2006]